MSCCNRLARPGATKRGTFVRGDSLPPHFVQLGDENHENTFPGAVSTWLQIRPSFKAAVSVRSFRHCCLLSAIRALLSRSNTFHVLVKILLQALLPHRSVQHQIRSAQVKRGQTGPFWAPGSCVSSCLPPLACAWGSSPGLLSYSPH